MFRSVFLILGAIIPMVGSAAADALHLNPSQRAGRPSLQEFEPTTIPFGYYDFCKRYPSLCARPTEKKSVELTEERWQAMVKANWLANTTIMPKTDQEIFGVEERWEYPATYGDCEDYVLLKRKLLLDQGFPLGALRITVGLDADGGGHAVLTVVTDMGDFVLDNVEQKIERWDETEIQYLKRQSGDNQNVWLSLIDPVVAARSMHRERSTAKMP